MSSEQPGVDSLFLVEARQPYEKKETTLLIYVRRSSGVGRSFSLIKWVFVKWLSLQ
jgi:hypothetical protein